MAGLLRDARHVQGQPDGLCSRRVEAAAAAPRSYGIVHSGFPEPVQRKAELRTTELFAASMGWSWQGGVGFGGTSPIDGRPLEEAGMFSKQPRMAFRS